ncbi:MAG: glycogen phosphorylase [Solirubrobacteraceae bacterium]|jgi:starch phosphorylase|nr:glycogen phosphorylase [Solirubrobacteraceae bacterium]
MTSSVPVSAGSQDTRGAAEALASRVPAPLAPLARAAYNLRWSWTPGGAATFRAIDPRRWALCGENPVRLLTEAPVQALERAASDADLVRRGEELEEAIRADLERPPAPAVATPEHPVAFFCAEYGIHASLPIYSGGLGALAGDMLKEASDRALAMVAVGLLYHQGYFRQRIDASGWQHESWVPTDPERQPLALVTGDDGRPLTVTVPIAGEDVVAQVWRVEVGRVPLFLLDADRPENGALARWISARLYTGTRDLRLAQYALLGVGGMRALEAMGIEPSVVHLNEGHAALASLELARDELAGGAPLEEALAAGRRRTIFTTHTPVPAGNDTYEAGQVTDTLGSLAGELGVDLDDVVRLGRSHPDDPNEPFGVTQFALRTSRAANGVSRRHGEVARGMWSGLWPDRPVDEVPIGHVTNGVHLPTWLGDPMRELLDRHLGEGWLERAEEPATWEPLEDVADAELWAARQAQRAGLVEWVRERAVLDRLGREEPRDYVQAAAEGFDPSVLTIGFARRIATYKRLHLLMQSADRIASLLTGERKVQVLLAGKAHPRDEEAKHSLQALFSRKGIPELSRRVAYLEDYDLSVAGQLVRGCDVWVNLPRPPLEASGTSGMKSAANGGLQLSVLDGWWAEAYDGTNGWAISGDVDHDHAAQDTRDADELLRLLYDEIVPAFYDRDADGIPPAWIARVRASLRTNGPRFSAARMLRDYLGLMYAPAPAR